MTIFITSKLFLSALALAKTACYAQQLPPPLPSVPSIRGSTYCEVIWAGPLSSPSNPPTTATVSWNGTGGACPSSPGFYNLTEADIQAVHGDQADVVIWNGIRQWTLDYFIAQQNTTTSISSSNDTTGEQPPQSEGDVFYEYGKDIFPDGSGLIMRRQATLDISGGGISSPFTPRAVKRYQTAVWLSGSTVYELVAPNCSQIYVMQSFMMGRPDSWGIPNASDLALLESLLELPGGWSFRNRSLSEHLYIYGDPETGVTNVLQDNLRNSYSRMDTEEMMMSSSTLCAENVDDLTQENASGISSSGGQTRQSSLLFAIGLAVSLCLKVCYCWSVDDY